jgi:hypothetical protein
MPRGLEGRSNSGDQIMPFYAINAFKSLPQKEQVVGLGESYPTAQAAEDRGREEAGTWPDRMFIRVIQAPDYQAACAACKKLRR